MLTTTISDFRKEMRKYVDLVTESNDILVINRGKDAGVVIMSIETYNSFHPGQPKSSSGKAAQIIKSSHERLMKDPSYLKEPLEP